MLTINKERRFIKVDSDDSLAGMMIYRNGDNLVVTVDEPNGFECIEETISIAEFLDTLGITTEGKE